MLTQQHLPCPTKLNYRLSSLLTPKRLLVSRVSKQPCDETPWEELSAIVPTCCLKPPVIFNGPQPQPRPPTIVVVSEIHCRQSFALVSFVSPQSLTRTYGSGGRWHCWFHPRTKSRQWFTSTPLHSRDRGPAHAPPGATDQRVRTHAHTAQFAHSERLWH